MFARTCVIQKVISSVPGAEDLFVRHQRKEVNLLAEVYLQDKHRVEQELRLVTW